MKTMMKLTSAGPPQAEGSKVKKNSKGGVLVTNEELVSAFNLLDSDKSGRITLQNLKKRLGNQTTLTAVELFSQLSKLIFYLKNCRCVFP